MHWKIKIKSKWRWWLCSVNKSVVILRLLLHLIYHAFIFRIWLAYFLLRKFFIYFMKYYKTNVFFKQMAFVPVSLCYDKWMASFQPDKMSSRNIGRSQVFSSIYSYWNGVVHVSTTAQRHKSHVLSVLSNNKSLREVFIWNKPARVPGLARPAGLIFIPCLHENFSALVGEPARITRQVSKWRLITIIAMITIQVGSFVAQIL